MDDNMKICWSNLEGIHLTRNGVFLKNNRNSYIYMDSCSRCGKPYLTIKCRPSKFCDRSCAQIGKSFSEGYGKKISETKKGVPTKHGGYVY